MAQRRTGAVVLAIYNALYPDRSLYGAQLIEQSALATGSVYPALARLVAAGVIVVDDVGPSAASDGRERRRKVYRLTDAGRDEARRELQRFNALGAATVPTTVQA